MVEEEVIQHACFAMALLYRERGEAVAEVDNQCFYIYAHGQKIFSLSATELDYLIESGVIELDSGCNEEEHETRVYVLTENAEEKIRAIIRTMRRKFVGMKI